MSTDLPQPAEAPKKLSNSFLRKQALKKDQYDPKNFSLDATKFNWDPSCKKCHGRGFIGKLQPANKWLLCSCASEMRPSKKGH